MTQRLPAIPRLPRPAWGGIVLLVAAAIVAFGALGGSLGTPASSRSNALAPAASTETAGEAAPAPSAWGTAADPFEWPGLAVDMAVKLAVVLALAYGLLALLRRYTLGPQQGRVGQLQVLEQSTLAPNRAIYLVRAGDRQLLLGVTPTQITTLTTWEHAPAAQPEFSLPASPATSLAELDSRLAEAPAPNA
jgi:flagellar biosynthetic protein FliO